MPRVLILGGSGYLGLAIGQALLRSGNYTVWGTARSAEKAKTLELNEISSINADFTDGSALKKIIKDNKIDIVIDSSSAYEQASVILSSLVAAAEEREAQLAKDGMIGPKLGLVYTSGSWVWGDTPARGSDLIPSGSALAGDQPASMVAWRPGHEQAILKARTHLDVAIMRPGTIFGRGSWVFSPWWSGLLAASKSGSSEAVAIPVNATTRTSLVHVDDCAEAYVKACDQIGGGLGAWPIFDVYGEISSVPEICEGVKKVLGVKAPITYTGTQGNVFFEALACTQNNEISRARTVLGWNPRHRHFVETLPQTVTAWKAAQSETE